jgi:hypothetical protein
LLKNQKPVRASFTNIARVSRSDIEDIFRRLPPPGLGYTLIELLWDDNFVTRAIFAALRKCPHLRVLSLSGVLSVPGDDTSYLIAHFLLRNRSVRDLRIGGTMENSLRSELLHEVIETLRTANRTVEALDISHNPFTREVIDAVMTLLLDNRVIVALNFQDCGITDPVVLDDFLRRLSARGHPLKVALPKVDIEEMYRIGAVTREIHQGLVDLVKIPQSTRRERPSSSRRCRRSRTRTRLGRGAAAATRRCR